MKLELIDTHKAARLQMVHERLAENAAACRAGSHLRYARLVEDLRHAMGRETHPEDGDIIVFLVRDYEIDPTPAPGTRLVACDELWVPELAANPADIRNAIPPGSLGTMADAARITCPHCRGQAYVLGSRKKETFGLGLTKDVHLHLACDECLRAELVAPK